MHFLLTSRSDDPSSPLHHRGSEHRVVSIAYFLTIVITICRRCFLYPTNIVRDWESVAKVNTSHSDPWSIIRQFNSKGKPLRFWVSSKRPSTCLSGCLHASTEQIGIFSHFLSPSNTHQANKIINLADFTWQHMFYHSPASVLWNMAWYRNHSFIDLSWSPERNPKAINSHLSIPCLAYLSK